MIHIFAKEYGWSKSQLNEIYPEEAIILLKFIAQDKKDEQALKQIQEIEDKITQIFIYHGDPKQVKGQFEERLNKLLKESGLDGYDDDLPDFEKFQQLKDFLATHRRKKR